MRFARASASRPRTHDVIERVEVGVVQLKREDAGVDARELEEVVDERSTAFEPGRLSAGRYSSGSASPSSIASSIACIEASGVRRSWLAQATSSRRASKSRSIDSAIALNDPTHLRELAGAFLAARARRDRLRRASPRSRAAARAGRRIQRASRSAPTTAESAAAEETARILASSCMWNITQPEASTPPSGRTTASSASPASCSRTVGSSRSSERGGDPDGDRAERRG